MGQASFLTEHFSADGLCAETARQALERRYAPLLAVDDQFNRKSVSYQLSKHDALHSWLKYKEGFSSDLVNTLLDEWNIQPGDWVLDPFVGSGTVALVCQMRGIHSIGYDVLPLSETAIQAKAHAFHYDLNEIAAMTKAVRGLDCPPNYQGQTPYITITKDAYPEGNARFLQLIKEWRDASVYSAEAKTLLTLCIINSLERCSYTVKSGQYLGWDSRSNKVAQANAKRLEKGRKPLAEKQVRKTICDSKEAILEELAHVAQDIAQIQGGGCGAGKAEIRFSSNSVLYELPRLESNFLGGVITSPPYCNRYDYTRTYALELVYLGLGEQEMRKLRQALLSCTVENCSKMDALRQYYKDIGESGRFAQIAGTIRKNQAFGEIMEALCQREARGDLNNKGVLRMVEGYFTELAFVYGELYRVCRPGAQVAFVNDNVRYGGEVIPVDFLSCSLAEQLGFRVKRIYTLRQQKGNSSQQMAKFGRVPLRKSITVWEKP